MNEMSNNHRTPIFNEKGQSMSEKNEITFIFGGQAYERH
jgi:hypothetical protein